MVEEVTPPVFAPMAVLPTPLVVARPAPFGPLAMVATLEEDELQCVLSVTSWVVASLNVPVAVNCCGLPSATEGAAGVMAIELSVPLLTVRTVVPLIPEALAVMVAVPSFLPLATPVERIEAICGFDDFHDKPLRFDVVLLSLKVPMAVSLINVCCWILGLAGLMAMLTRFTTETVRPVEPLTEPTVALIVVVPAATLEASP